MKFKVLAAGLMALPLMATAVPAQDLPATRVTVLGNIGITTQSRTIEAPFWNQQVRELSGGRITANFRPWSEAGLRGPEVFRILARGQANIASAQLGHHAGDAAINDGSDLAGLTGSMEEFRRVTDAFRPVMNQFYERQLGLVPITYQSYQSQVLYCRNAISGLADLRGRRVRTSGASQGDFVAYFGGTPVDVAFGETQQALAQGTIDCAITGTLSGYVAKWYEAAKYIYTLPVNYGSGATVANGQWWRGLNPAVRDFLTRELRKVEDRMWALNFEEDAMGIACNTQGPCPLGAPGGMTRVDPTPADTEARRRAALERVLPNWARRCGAECVQQWNDTVGKLVGLQARIPQ